MKLYKAGVDDILKNIQPSAFSQPPQLERGFWSESKSHFLMAES